MLIIVLWWVVELEQAGGLHGVIRQFQLILRVFIKQGKFGWILLSYICLIILFFIPIFVSFYIVMLIIVLWWIFELEQAGSMHGVIR